MPSKKLNCLERFGHLFTMTGPWTSSYLLEKRTLFMSSHMDVYSICPSVHMYPPQTLMLPYPLITPSTEIGYREPMTINAFASSFFFFASLLLLGLFQFCYVKAFSYFWTFYSDLVHFLCNCSKVWNDQMLFAGVRTFCQNTFIKNTLIESVQL
jgi:hypothetical protein